LWTPAHCALQCDKMVLNLALHVRNKHQTDSVNTAEGLAQCRWPGGGTLTPSGQAVL
jgi:hypothetical protein